jgi:hypothetical protein
VWDLVSEPGWYINDNQIVEHRIERTGAVAVVHDPVHGAFAFRTVELDEPRYAAFRWMADASDPSAASTLVEFWIEERPDSTVVLKVTESGFASLPGDAQERRRQFDASTEGWRIELSLAKRHLEGVRAAH